MKVSLRSGHTKPGEKIFGKVLMKMENYMYTYINSHWEGKNGIKDWYNTKNITELPDYVLDIYFNNLLTSPCQNFMYRKDALLKILLQIKFGISNAKLFPEGKIQFNITTKPGDLKGAISITKEILSLKKINMIKLTMEDFIAEIESNDGEIDDLDQFIDSETRPKTDPYLKQMVKERARRDSLVYLLDDQYTLIKNVKYFKNLDYDYNTHKLYYFGVNLTEKPQIKELEKMIVAKLPIMEEIIYRPKTGSVYKEAEQEYYETLKKRNR